MQYVYFIRANSGEYLVGSSHNPKEKLRELQEAHIYAMELVGEVAAKTYPERWVQRKLDPYRIQRNWFSPTPEVQEFVELILAGRLPPPGPGERRNPKPWFGAPPELYEDDQPKTFTSKYAYYQWRRRKPKPIEVEYDPVPFEEVAPQVRALLRKLGYQFKPV